MDNPEEIWEVSRDTRGQIVILPERRAALDFLAGHIETLGGQRVTDLGSDESKIRIASFDIKAAALVISFIATSVNVLLAFHHLVPASFFGPSATPKDTNTAELAPTDFNSK